MQSSDMAIVVAAAGRGARAGGDIPKQYRPLAGRPVLTRTLDALAAVAPDAALIVAIHPDDRALFDAALAQANPSARKAIAVEGGATRQASVRAGLRAAAAAGARIVLIHDAARPFPSVRLIEAATDAARARGAATPALPVADSLRSIDADGRIVGEVDRASVRAVQTPQAFALDIVLDAHERAATADREDFTDDAALVLWAGGAVHTFEGEAGNMKLTHPADFASAESRLLMALPDIRTGMGYDVHAFGPGDCVWLGGVRIAHDHALVGHSDADVLLHALTDAILGAIADGDIGAHFPPSDPQWRGAASDLFLRDAVARVAARGGIIAHLDATIVCEAPRVGPHREAIRASIARIAGIDVGRVAVKATTSERLGFTGRREGIAAQAVAAVRLPLSQT